MKHEDKLISIWEDFCKQQNLPNVSADEIESIEINDSEIKSRYPERRKENNSTFMEISQEAKDFARAYVKVWCYFQNDGF